MPNDTITLTVNGDPVNCSPQSPVTDVIAELNYNPRLVAVEYNGEILHRQHWSETIVKEGDKLEIVTIVGGGSGKN
ncbi:thiamine biosynthesis protein ThiS [Halothece sp. PCC 7418]|uniref:sulfur carrier protein ThiS n=1 Tax=Halothece sp. (strain PCC 7418) TaxID=65093 RepID=UPI0002A07B99|nr:sulfur carrier protein ThiS [Halothece sp. PCC 7418]AFZ44310.1 thiamine biosynthesis protein ThiS [Halothece sp. PCC 7418]